VHSIYETFIRVTVREVLGISRGRSGGHRVDCWWNGEVQGKLDPKKLAYAKLVESKTRRRSGRIGRSIS